MSQAVTLEGEIDHMGEVDKQLIQMRGQEESEADSGKPSMSCKGVDAAGRTIEEWDYLNKFFRRYNKALLDKVCCGVSAGMVHQCFLFQN